MTINNFESLGIDSNILKALKDIDYNEPSPIQAQGIPIALAGHDMIGMAQTGTGKTAAFGIPMIQRISKSGRFTKGLVLCPTRELCIQVTNELKKLAAHTPHVAVHAIYGGDPINTQIKALNKGVDIVVGTPGRVIDHLERRTLLIDHLEILALDEADEMLNMGFRDELERILETVPKERQTILFSATMPKEIKDIALRFLNNPEEVRITPRVLTAESIDQFYIDTDMKARFNVLQFLFNHITFNQAIVFCNTKAKVDELSSDLAAQQFKNDVLHGDLSQDRRNKILNRFRDGSFKVLIATDVAARGIDVPNIDVVINYDIPLDPEYYVHRIGRTGRAGKSGTAYSFIVGARDKRLVRQIEDFAKVKMVKYKLPDSTEIARLEMGKMKKILIDIIESKKEQIYLDYAREISPPGASPLEVIAAILYKFIPPAKVEWPTSPSRDGSASSEGRKGGRNRSNSESRYKNNKNDRTDRRKSDNTRAFKDRKDKGSKGTDEVKGEKGASYFDSKFGKSKGAPSKGKSTRNSNSSSGKPDANNSSKKQSGKFYADFDKSTATSKRGSKSNSKKRNGGIDLGFFKSK